MASIQTEIGKFTTAERDALTPAPPVGTIIFNTTLGLFQSWNGTIWTSSTSPASPGGSSTQVQFNDGGAFGGDANFVYDKTQNSLALGESCVATGLDSFAHGNAAQATGDYSHASGVSVRATTSYAHAEGVSAVPGVKGLASGAASHVEGSDCIASGNFSHAQGRETIASHSQGDASGFGTKTGRTSQSVVGTYNLGLTDTYFEVGRGTFGLEANAFSVSDDARARILGEVLQPRAVLALTAGFTIDPNGPPVRTYVPLDAFGGAVTSSATTAITSGLEAGQVLVLENRDPANSITLKNGANTRLPLNADYILTIRSTITLIWNGSIWTTLNVSEN